MLLVHVSIQRGQISIIFDIETNYHFAILASKAKLYPKGLDWTAVNTSLTIKLCNVISFAILISKANLLIILKDLTKQLWVVHWLSNFAMWFHWTFIVLLIRRSDKITSYDSNAVNNSLTFKLSNVLSKILLFLGYYIFNTTILNSLVS